MPFDTLRGCWDGWETDARNAGALMTTVVGPSAGQADGRARSEGAGDGRFSPATVRWVGVGAFALLAYVPILLTHPGRVEADTKTYLYLDPGRLLTQALTMWDPSIGLGTVSHQTIGYLFPMGPFYWVLEQGLGLPAWVSQRLWLGSLIFGAGMGIWFLLRTIGVRGPGVPVGVLAYAFSPYVLQYSARFSAILGPWAALPVLIALVVLGLRRGGWRYAAIFALVIQLVGSVNATALVFAGLGPVLWIPYAVWIRRDATLSRAWQVLWRTALLVLVTSLWWMAGLWAQGVYGLDILQFTETVETTALTSYSSEIWRGLGYWFFYFRDIVGPWNDAVRGFAQRPATIVVSFAVPALALATAMIVRWRDRVFFIGLIVVGMVIAVGASPYDNPSPVGSLFKSFAAGSSAGLALRSTSRAVPLLILGLAMLLAAGVNAAADALSVRGRSGFRLGLGVAAAVGVLLIANAPGVWGGQLFSTYLERDEEVPEYWQAALADVDARPHDTRVLALPGSDFAAYRWGVTVDPIEPGLIDRPYVARELVPWGSPASAGFLEAIDRRVQTGELDPDAIAPLARLLAAGDVLLRLDLQTERYNLIRSEDLWQMFTDPPPGGLDEPRIYGAEIPDEPAIVRIDEATIAAGQLEEPPPVAIFGVEDPQTIIRATPTQAPLVLAGDADGVVDVAAVGLLRTDQVVLFSGSFAAEPEVLRAQLDHGATLVVTDTNRKRSHRWTGSRDSSGYTEQPDEEPLREDPRDARLDIFPDASLTAFTVADQRGISEVVASGYGVSGLSPQPGFRPALAIDGDPETAWEVGGKPDAVEGESIRVVLDEPITTDHVNLVQPIRGPRGRWIQEATITFDGKDPERIRLGAESRDESAAGQTIRFPRRTFDTFELTIDRIHEAPGSEWRTTPREGDSVRWNASYVGLAEIRLQDDAPGAVEAVVDEYLVMPSDLLEVAGRSSLDHPLILVMTRDGRAVDPKTDAELGIQRVFSLPTARDFALAGIARINPGAPDEVVDRVLGIPDATAGGITVTSSDHLFGDLASRGSSALDGDPGTAWTTPLGDVDGQSLQIKTSQPVTVDGVELEIVNDEVHSTPRRLTITSGDGTQRTVQIPDVRTQSEVGGTAAVVAPFQPLTGTEFTVTIDGVRGVYDLDYASLSRIAMPVGIAELGLAGIERGPMPEVLPTTCRTDLLRVDGEAVGVRLEGSTKDAARGATADLERCDGSPLVLGPGDHDLVAAPGVATGIDLDRLAWSSDAGGSGEEVDAIEVSTPPEVSTPKATVLSEDATTATVRVEAATEPFWLVLGQSINAGWTANVDGKDLGSARLVDGFANGWEITPPADGGPIIVKLAWTPQRTVDLAMAASLAAVFACLAIAFVGTWRARRRESDQIDQSRPQLATPLVVGGTTPGLVRIAVTAVLTGLAAAALIQPWCGLLVGGLVALVLVRPRLRFLLTFFPAIAVAGFGFYIAWNQFDQGWTADILWPARYWRLRTLGWLALALLGADAIVGLVRRAEPTTGEPVTGDDEESCESRSPELPSETGG